MLSEKNIQYLKIDFSQYMWFFSCIRITG